jgi:hypothetical protein
MRGKIIPANSSTTTRVRIRILEGRSPERARSPGAICAWNFGKLWEQSKYRSYGEPEREYLFADVIGNITELVSFISKGVKQY